MTYIEAIILNAVFATLVIAGLARLVWFGVSSHREPSFAARHDERDDELLAA